MLRLIVVVAAVTIVGDCLAAHHDGYHRQSCQQGGHQHHRYHGHRSYYQGPAYGHYPGYGYPGFGLIDPYAYDPYKYGRFRMQDPTDDPYLREKYRYDTFFPGRKRKHRRRLFGN